MNIVALAEYSESSSENEQSAYQETSGVTYVFNHPSEGYINYIPADVSAQVMSTQNDDQNSSR